MRNTLLLGIRQYRLPIPRVIWRRLIAREAQRGAAHAARYMSPEHHLIRDYVVRELPRVGKPLSPEVIGQQVNLPVERVNVILDDLEKRLIFLFRNAQGAVAWAYPVTVDTTPHHLTYSSGEQGYAA